MTGIAADGLFPLQISLKSICSQEVWAVNVKLLTFLVLTSACFLNPTSASMANDWITTAKAASQMKQERRKGNIPTSVQCRNSPSAKNRLKAEVKISWQQNRADKQWILILYKNAAEWKPGFQPGEEKAWIRKTASTVQSSAGTMFRCSLWYHRTHRASGSDAHKVIHARVGGGFRTIWQR